MTAKVNDFRLSIVGKELKPVKAARDLGVRLETNLTISKEHYCFYCVLTIRPNQSR